MWVVGIVGGIASGKSLVSRQFREQGARWIDVDRLGHEVLLDPVVRSTLAARWGNSILAADGQVDRAQVAKRVFAAGEQGRVERAYLEQLVHPLIAARVTAEIADLRQREPSAVVVLDAALLVEAGWTRFCDSVVFVDASDDVRRRRAIERGWTEAEWRAREAAQLNLGKKREVAHYTLDNSLSTTETYKQVQELWERFQIASQSPSASPPP
jgi:dephospho-CoA kinase